MSWCVQCKVNVRNRSDISKLMLYWWFRLYSSMLTFLFRMSLFNFRYLFLNSLNSTKIHWYIFICRSKRTVDSVFLFSFLTWIIWLGDSWLKLVSFINVSNFTSFMTIWTSGFLRMSWNVPDSFIVLNIVIL